MLSRDRRSANRSNAKLACAPLDDAMGADYGVYVTRITHLIRAGRQFNMPSSRERDKRSSKGIPYVHRSTHEHSSSISKSNTFVV